jgi:hypothetical protein
MALEMAWPTGLEVALETGKHLALARHFLLKHNGMNCLQPFLLCGLSIWLLN